jgi:hypothetical protein
LTETVTDTSRDQDPDGSDEPTTGPPAGAAGQLDPAAGQPDPTGPPTAAGQPGAIGVATPESEAEQRQRRRRRLFVIAIAVGAAIVVIALCAGALGIISAVDGFRDRSDDARETRALRDTACLELEQRLNRLTPPGATGGPQTRSIAVQSENAAVRIYVNEIHSQRDQDGWRQVLDARTAYAEALAQQAKSRTPAFYVAPRAGDGRAVTDELIRWSPEPCGGPIRRLAAPDL